MNSSDYIICGGGILGLTIARELVAKTTGSILILEKEHDCGLHASGRNSGVLHAGIYYDPDSFRAATCLAGNRLMKKYCRQKGLPVHENGKVIVAANRDELPALDRLYERAVQNGASVSIIDEDELLRVEPRARTCEKALFSKETAVVDPSKIIKSLKYDLLNSGRVKIFFNTSFSHKTGPHNAMTSRGPIEYGTFINTAGVYSLAIARQWGLGSGYVSVPFKGTYRKLPIGMSEYVRGNIYPVPDPAYPFLGVHFTRAIDGTVYVGPTAIPAFGEEQYGLFRGLNLRSAEFLFRDAMLFIKNHTFRRLAYRELRKYFTYFFYKDAKKLLQGLSFHQLHRSSKAGIRSQLVNPTTGTLVNDFIIEKDDESLHVLNAVSPAFTSSMEISRILVEQYLC